MRSIALPINALKRLLRTEAISDFAEVSPHAAMSAPPSAYLAHVHVADTQWYLEGSPALMREAMRRLEQRWEDRALLVCLGTTLRRCWPMRWHLPCRNDALSLQKLE